MPFTAQELENISNGVIDYYMRGPALSQTIQEKPLLHKLVSMKKSFPGGKEFISCPVKGVYTTTTQGYSHDDEVSYANPANIKRAVYQWKELHAGIQMTLTELKHEGISIVDSMNMGATTTHSERELVLLTGILEDKLEDMAEGRARGLEKMFWRDGTQDAKEIPGLRSFIVNVPASGGSVGGLDPVANTWWRNRASLSINSATPSNQNLVNTLQQEWRQLRRYGGRPDAFYGGSDFLDAYEKELRALGTYTESGWSKNGGSLDASIGDGISFKGIQLVYEPELDDLGLAKFGYVLDCSKIKLRDMDGEWEKLHNPARPPERYVLYRAVTDTAGLVCTQRNAQGVYSIA